MKYLRADTWVNIKRSVNDRVGENFVKAVCSCKCRAHFCNQKDEIIQKEKHTYCSVRNNRSW